ncbi:ABC transporter ATP-binding protein [Streptomyces sp. NPDC005805]|uniref:ABC transporter ATP-binding protein n=1 Tax=Streptomyces sp. NPDC005805 TaxID=3157068 RepID=UPI0034098E2C
MLLCSVGGAVAAVAQPLVLGRTLDLLLRGETVGGWLLLAALLLTAEVVLDALTALATGRCNARWTAAVRTAALGGLLRTAPGRAGAYSPGDVATRLTLNAADAGTAPAARAGLTASLFTPAGALVALAFVDVWVAGCVLAGMPLLALVLRVFARDTSASVGEYQRVQSEIASRLTESLAGAATVTAAGTWERERARVLAPLAGLGAVGARMWAVHGRAVALSGVLVPLLTVAAVAVGGIRLSAGAVTAGDLLAICRYAALAAGVGSAATLLGGVVRGRVARERTGELEGLPPVRHGTRALPAEGPGTLELRGVSVTRAGRAVLRGVDLRVPGGSTAAVVGASGAGKSVLAAVAGRLADPDAGRVLLDGVPLAELSRPELRREVGYAFARPVLGGGTVAEALAAGPRRVTADQLAEAVRAAGAASFVDRLPTGVDTPLAGAPLSGGEHQRLGLARAFAHAGRLLVLDDATSSLDTATEYAVDLALRHRVRPGTRLVVAHRPSVAARADLVVWLERGRVRAVAPHTELWQEAAYRAVFRAADGDGAPPGGVSEGPPRGAAAPGGSRPGADGFADRRPDAVREQEVRG